MKINWTVRLKNKVWLATFLSFIVSTVYQWLGYFDIAPVVTQEAQVGILAELENQTATVWRVDWDGKHPLEK